MADNFCGIPGIPRGTIEDYARYFHPEWFATNEKGLWDTKIEPPSNRMRAALDDLADRVGGC